MGPGRLSGTDGAAHSDAQDRSAGFKCIGRGGSVNTAAVLLIGDEILAGKYRDENGC